MGFGLNKYKDLYCFYVWKVYHISPVSKNDTILIKNLFKQRQSLIWLIGLKRINHIHKNATLSNSALSFFAKANELQIKIHAENNDSTNVWDTIYF